MFLFMNYKNVSFDIYHYNVFVQKLWVTVKGLMIQNKTTNVYFHKPSSISSLQQEVSS